MEELAIMSNIIYGVRDTNHAGLWFTVSMLGTGALLGMGSDAAKELVEKYSIYDIKQLEGKPCVVNIEDGIARFVRLVEPKGRQGRDVR